MPNNSQLCRACLTTKDTFTYKFFENVSPELFYFCTSIEVHPDEELSKVLCNSCYELLTKYADFKHTCLQSQKSLFDFSKTFEKVDVCASDIQDYEPDSEKLKTEVALPIKQESDGEDYDNGFLEATDFPNEPLQTITVKLKKRKVKKATKLKGDCNNLKEKRKFLYTCDVCQRKFNYLIRFEAHRMEHDGKTISIKCQTCNKTFATWSGLKRHNESEHTLVSLKSLRCGVCGKISKSRQTLQMHMKLHEQRRVSVCNECGKRFTSAVVLRTHLETHKENRERRFTCEHCGKKFYTNSILMSHMSRLHTGRRYICQICEYPFTDKYNLAKHLLIHEGKKLHKCDICQKSFAAVSTLQEHKRIHSGERPYSCQYCNKGFVSKKRLTDHVRIHTGDKPYKCTVCEQRFTQRGTVKRHMKVHDRGVPNIS